MERATSGILGEVPETRRERWETAVGWPLTLAAVAFLAAYAWPILDPNLGQPWSSLCLVIAWGTWGLFALDYLARVALAGDKPRFIRTHVLDLVVIALPLLRPLRLLRLMTLLNVLHRHAGGSLRGKVAIYIGGSTVLVLFVAALPMLDAERGAEGANIHSFQDVIWWAITTVTTVGKLMFHVIGALAEFERDLSFVNGP